MSRQLKAVIKDQERFVEEVSFTLFLLKVYQNNPKEFSFLISEALRKKYHWTDSTNPNHIWEFINELSSNISNRDIHVRFEENGMFPVLVQTKKSGLTISKIMARLKDCDKLEWKI